MGKIKISEEKKVLLVMFFGIAATIYAIIDIILQIQAGFYSRIILTFFLLVYAVFIVVASLIAIKKKE